MSDAYGKADDATSLATLDRAVDLGVTLLDTSDSYGPFANEELLSRVLVRRRPEVVIATKFGQRLHPDGSRSVDGTRDYARAACDASLRRLGIDSIDLYYQHRVDRTCPSRRRGGPFTSLVSRARCAPWASARPAAPTIRRAHATHPVTALQTEWSLWTRDVEANGVLATVRELGIGFVAYSPLGRGFLTGAITSNDDLPADDGRRGWPRFQDDALTANRAILDGVRSVAGGGRTPRPGRPRLGAGAGRDVVPIPGSRGLAHLEDNVGALRPAPHPRPARTARAGRADRSAVGARYPAPLMRAIDT